MTELTSETYQIRDQSPRNHIILVTIDTLRADHLSSYGYPKQTTPFLDSMAREGITFARAYAPSSTTVPSHTSLFTGMYPREVGITSNRRILPDRITTLAELLQQNGYKTAGFVGTNRHFESTNLDQGFTVFNESTPREQMVSPSFTEKTFDFDYRPAKRTLKQAKNWIEQQPAGQKTFLWLHLFDAHWPYVYRNKHYQQISHSNLDRRRDWVEFIRNNHHFNLTKGGSIHRPKKNKFLNTHRLYDSELRYLDSQLNGFFEFVRSQWGQIPFTILTSDHGEGMGNHNWWGHSKYVYNEQIRIPLIIYSPEEKNWRGDKLQRTVELLDLMPTILEQAGVPYQQINKQRKNPIHARSLRCLIEEKQCPRFGFALAQRRTSAFIGTGMTNWFQYRWRKMTFDPIWYPLHPRLRHKAGHVPGHQFSLLNGSYSYVYNELTRDEFYDLSTDYYQQTNIIQQSESYKPFSGSLNTILERLQKRSPSDVKRVGPKTRKQLRGLGYL
ncbi:MAG: sulfatase [bacterium]